MAIEVELDLKRRFPQNRHQNQTRVQVKNDFPTQVNRKFQEAERKGEKAIPRRNNTTNPQRHGTCSREFKEFGDQSKGGCRQAKRWA